MCGRRAIWVSEWTVEMTPYFVLLFKGCILVFSCLETNVFLVQLNRRILMKGGGKCDLASVSDRRAELRFYEDMAGDCGVLRYTSIGSRRYAVV